MSRFAMHKPSSFRDYSIAVLIGAVVTVFFGLYLYIRRGYVFDAPLTADVLYVPNKAIAGAAVVMLAFTFLIGPISRYFQSGSVWLQYRKEIGIVGAFLAFTHSLISAKWLPLKFPADKILDGGVPFVVGAIASVVLVALFFTSFLKAIDWLGAKRWWFFQRFGLRLVVLLTVIHLFVMKWSGWQKWYETGVPQTPELTRPDMIPASILVGIFVAWVSLIRLYESVFVFKSFGISPQEHIPDEQALRNGRRFLIASFWSGIALIIVLALRALIR